MKKSMILIALAAMLSMGFALNLQVSVDVNAWESPSRSTETAPLLEAGVPALSYIPVRVLLPFGEEVQSVNVVCSSPQLQRSNLSLDYVRAQQPTSKPTADLTVPNPTIWQSNALYPTSDFSWLGVQSQRGYRFAVINIYPWKYNPVTRELFASDSYTIDIQTQWSADVAASSANFHTPALDDAEIRDFVLNPETAATYRQSASYRTHTPQSRLIDLSVPKKMIIITNSASEPLFQSYIQWRNTQNVSTAVYQTSDIYDVYEGEDNAEKVRNFISDAYQTWSSTASPLEYVILGGDDEIVPERGCYGQVGDTVDQRMPTDIYYSNLDGDWNADADNIWGEQFDEVDMLPEVAIGRFPAETAAEFGNIIRKTQYYVNYNTFSNNMAVMFGENLNWNPVTWGGDYKDDVALHIPESYFLTTMYQRDGTYSEQGVWNAINNGAHVMNHMGHANETFLLGQGNNTIEQLENTEYGFLYTQGCYPAAFDQRTSGDGESIAEHLSTTDGGVFAFIGNTRYGWYAPGSINGASQYYDREYFIGLYETLNTQFGKALNYSRQQNLNEALSNDVMRWCYYEVVLFGDPSIEVKYPDPSLPLLSMESYTITDEEGDNDGSFNPGEILRIYPVIRNHQDWATALNVTLSLENLPAGVQVLGGNLVIPQILPGQTNPNTAFLRVQLPLNLGYATYSFKIAVDSVHPVTNLSTGIRKYNLSYAITMIDGDFPWDCPVQTKSAPVVFDMDDDGNLDIVYQDVHGQAYYIDSLGEDFDGFSPIQQLDIMRSSSLGDITGDGVPELVYASRTNRIYATSLEGQPVFGHTSDSPYLFTPIIARLDTSGTDKVVATSLDGYLHALNGDGTYLCGFPTDLGSPSMTEIAAADIDGDGLMEIVTGTQNGLLNVTGLGGTQRDGFPVQCGGSITGSPTILDNNRIAVGTGSNMLLVSPEGSILVTKPISAPMASGPVIADLDRDGELEIIFVTLGGTLYAVHQDGTDLAGFPLTVGANCITPPLVANLDSDLFPEILVSSYVNSVYAYNYNGTLLDGFPFTTTFNGSTPATLCDLEGDDMLKLVEGYSTGVLVLNLRRAETSIMPWVTYRGSLKRQGSFAATGYVANDDPAVPAFADALSQNYPNPFNPSTTISFQTAKDGSSNLAIYNLKGQLVRTLHNSNLAKGDHNVIWDGTDSSGRAVSSGLYLYKLQTPDSTLTRRMLLVK